MTCGKHKKGLDAGGMFGIRADGKEDGGRLTANGLEEMRKGKRKRVKARERLGRGVRGGKCGGEGKRRT